MGHNRVPKIGAPLRIAISGNPPASGHAPTPNDPSLSHPKDFFPRAALRSTTSSAAKRFPSSATPWLWYLPPGELQAGGVGEEAVGGRGEVAGGGKQGVGAGGGGGGENVDGPLVANFNYPECRGAQLSTRQHKRELPASRISCNA